MTLEELALLNELLTSRFGLHFPAHKREILASRLLPRLLANRVQRYLDYYLLLHYDFAHEKDHLIRAVTNNESYFFREIAQFEVLRGELLSSLRAEGPVPDTLRVLSAGCSSGEEPYTLNIHLRQASFGYSGPPAQIEAIDIDQDRLTQAQQACYRPSSLRTLEDEQVTRYFQRRDEDTYELRRPFRKGVSFGTGNIADLDSFHPTVPYDVVFCRNVLIYFAEPALKAAIENFAQVVRAGGILFLGHSESIIGLTDSFQPERLGNCIAYRRVSP